MRVLVTGAAGFIGHHTVKYLLDQNYEVFGVDNFSNSDPSNLKRLGSWYETNFKQADIRSEYFGCCGYGEKVDAIVHLAAKGSVPKSFNNPDDYFDNNVAGLYNVLRYMGKEYIGKIVFSSSSSVYGNYENGTLESPYAATKVAGEKLIEGNKTVYNYRYIILRLFNIFGPGQKADSQYSPVIAKWARKIANNEEIQIYGETWRDYTYIANVTHAIDLALRHEKKCDVFCDIGCGQLTSLKELAQIMKACDIEYLPPRAGDRKQSVANLQIAKTALGYQPLVSLEQGLRCMN